MDLVALGLQAMLEKEGEMSEAKQHVLLVDDEPQVLVALEDLLCDRFIVHTANSAKAALRVADERDIAVVVTDQRMPGMSGDELVSQLRRDGGPKSILVTGYADLAAVVRAVNEGQIFAYVTKPWDEEDLRLKVSQAADQFRLTMELAEEKQLLHDLMRSAPDGIYFKNRSLHFLRVNEAFAELLGAEPSEVVGKRVDQESFSIEQADDVEREERVLLQTGEPILGNVRQFKSAGGTFWLSENKAPIRDNSGDVVGLVGISRDVTHQRQLEEQLLHAQKMEAVGRLAGGVAHDFNNLLAVIQSYGELLREEFRVNERARGDLDELLKANQRAASITKQLLTFSRRQSFKAGAIDLNEVLVGLENMLRRILSSGVVLELSLGASLPHIQGDVTQLEQVVLNLAVNARDAMPKGGRLTISTCLTRKDADSQSEVLLTVTDTGEGMRPEVSQRMFEPFYSTKGEHGTGLGLSTVYGIVEKCGGHIRCESEVKKGTTFFISFPVIAARVPPADEGRHVQSQDRTVVLLVEANANVRTAAAELLRDRGYQVLEAETAQAAREFSMRHPAVDLLVTDLVMPQANGRNLYSELKNRYPNLRALFMSGYAGQAQSGTFRVGADEEVLERPFSPSELAETVRQALAAS